MARGLGHLAAYMKDFFLNGSKIKILKIMHILMKISKYSILDQLYSCHQEILSFPYILCGASQSENWKHLIIKSKF